MASAFRRKSHSPARLQKPRRLTCTPLNAYQFGYGRALGPSFVTNRNRSLSISLLCLAGERRLFGMPLLRGTRLSILTEALWHCRPIPPRPLNAAGPTVSISWSIAAGYLQASAPVEVLRITQAQVIYPLLQFISRTTHLLFLIISSNRSPGMNSDITWGYKTTGITAPTAPAVHS